MKEYGRIHEYLKELRERAEKSLGDASSEESTGDGKREDEELDHLIHELQVHQAELEIQNEELQEAQQSLEISKERYVRLFDLAPVGYLLIDDKALIKDANLKAAKMLGVDRRNLYNLPFYIYVEKNYQQQFYRLLRRRSNIDPGNDVEILITPRKKESTWISLAVADFSDSQTEDTLILLALTDINRIKKAEEEILLRQKEAVEANKAKSRFLSNMSHEIRTPISGIIGVVDMLYSEEKDVKRQEDFKMIKESADTLLDIVNDVLDISKIEANKLELSKEVFNVKDVIRKSSYSIHAQVQKKGIELITEIDPEIPEYVEGDPYRLRQIYINLLGNANKFTEGGYIKITVEHGGEITKDGGQKYIRLVSKVEDTGIGISPEKQRNIFEAFTQADDSSSKSYSGTGLGLAICKELVEMMNGNITIESTVGKGTTFTFTTQFAVPNEQRILTSKVDGNSSDYKMTSPEGDVPEENAPPLDISEESNKEPMNIILAEDNLINRKFLNHFLIKNNFHVTLASNGEEVLQALGEDTYDLILMDIQMPIMDGVEATKRIREEGNTIPIVALTANAMKGDRERFMQSGMNDYITKPVKIDSLLELLDRYRKSRTSS